MNEDLVTWLRAQLDEDERGAREAAERDSGEWFMGDRWNVYRIEDEARYDDDYQGEENRLVVYGNIKSQSEHIARHDPARVLAEVEAKRRILDGWREADREAHVDDGDERVAALMQGRLLAYQAVTRRLGLPYADRPGYREEWRP